MRVFDQTGNWKLIATSATLHMIGYSPYVVLPTLAALGGIPKFELLLALTGLSAAGGLSSIVVGDALDRFGGSRVATFGLSVLTLGYAGLALAARMPELWLIMGCILGIGVQATGGQTAFYIVQKQHGVSSAQSHFVANIGISAAGLVLPWVATAAGMAGGWESINWTFSGLFAVAFLAGLSAVRKDQVTQDSQRQAAPKLQQLLNISSRRIAIAAGFGLLTAGTVIFNFLAANALAHNRLSLGSALIGAVALGAAMGRIGFAVILQAAKAYVGVDHVAIFCWLLQILACGMASWAGLPFWGALVIAFFYGLGASANLAVLPVFVERHFQGVGLGLALGQTRFVMTPFQVAALLAVGTAGSTLRTEVDAFALLAGLLLIAGLAIGAVSYGAVEGDVARPSNEG